MNEKQIIRKALRKIPCPVTLIGAKKEGTHNITTISWLTRISHDPFWVCINVSPKRHIHDFIIDTEEFAITVLAQNQGKIAMYCGTRSGKDVDKIKELGIETFEPQKIKVPLIKGAVANIECKLIKYLPAADHTIFIGQAIAATYEKDKFPLVLYSGIIKAKE